MELALAGALAPAFDAELVDCGLLEEQPATARAITATTPTDLVALERITGIDPFTLIGAGVRGAGWSSWRHGGLRPAVTGPRTPRRPGRSPRLRPARTAGRR